VTGSGSVGATTGAAAGGLFGAVMTLVLAGLQVARARRSDGTLAGVRESAEFVVPGDVARARAAAEQALWALGASPRTAAVGDDVVLEGRTGMSWKSWGEVVRVEIRPSGHGAVRVQVASRPALGTTLVDYGKALTNVNSVRAAMTR
jgi:hypothetical protein